ncbi:MAG TPA: hypothetical protein PKD61_22990, partial [Polyangiaceae bacterium]|nr:hypothetical protein [Polyangiaceae bacterium]
WAHGPADDLGPSPAQIRTASGNLPPPRRTGVSTAALVSTQMPVGGSARVRADDVTSPYDESVELTLSSGRRVRAIVRPDPSQSNRPKCLLLHGNPGSVVDWERVLPRITAICGAAVVDMPG